MNNRVILLFISLVFSTFLHAQNRDVKLNYALIDAAANGSTDSLIEILKRHPNINFRDGNNGTAIFYATQNNHLDIVKILIYNDANIDYAINGGFTPLMSACYNGYFELGEYLASHGANLDINDQYDANALHYAVAMGDFYMVDMLLFYGADALALTYENTSTILIASLIGDTTVARLLFEKGADIDRVNKLGYSPLSVAVQNNDSVMLDYLIELGAKTEVLKKQQYEPYAWALLNKNYYAYKKLKPERATQQSMANNRYNSLNIAYGIGDPDLITSIKNEGVTSGWFPYYNSATFQFSSSFNGADAFFNFGAGLSDAKYKTNIILNYGTRFKEKAILFEESKDTYLQLWEHRRYFELYFQKRFEFQMDYFDVSIYAGLGAQWMFGNYSGVRRKVYPSFALVPQFGIQLDMRPVFFTVGYEYTAYKLSDISGHKIKIGLGYQLNFVKKPKKYSLLWI